MRSIGLTLLVIFCTIFGCKKKNLQLPPTLTTTAVSNITDSTAMSGGAFTSIGNLSVSAYGMQWDTLASFAGRGYISIDGAGTSSYASILTQLARATTYYVRAYAIAAKDTVYGNVLQFTTAN
jgi:hypothetical protein